MAVAVSVAARKTVQRLPVYPYELSPNFGDGLKAQAAA
jgi:hypothetical protein